LPAKLKSVAQLPISLCYILKDEEQFLAASIDSALPFISELILVDSGSTDRSKEIAHSFRDRVPSFIWKEILWPNDFAAARNIAADLARQDWILFLDGDEVLDSDAGSRIAMAIQQPSEVFAFSLIQRNYTRNPQLEDARRTTKTPPGLSNQDQQLFYIENWMERLFRRGIGIRYEGVIHETIIPSCERLGFKHARLPVVLHHHGRLKKIAPEKLRYYLSLTEQKWRTDQNHPVPWIELAINLMELQEMERAFEIATGAVEKFPQQPEILRMAYQAALRSDRFEIAEQWIRNFLKMNPKDLYSKAQLTTALLYQRKFADTLVVADEIFREDPANFVAHLNCGVIYFEEKRFHDAKRHLQLAQQERPQDLFVQEALKKIQDEIQKH
jgi:glycosyltransferase involved in cell wall biosynthesis